MGICHQPSILTYYKGFGKYNYGMLVTCCLLIMAMYLDIFGFSVVMPAVACDMALTTSQQGLLSAVPLIGVMISSYGWGLCADTRGRRTTLLIAMPVGFILNLAASMAPDYPTLATLKFFSATFTSSANAAAFVLMAESVPARLRGRFMFLMASATMVIQFVICVFALPVFTLTFHLRISWLNMEYRPWRLLMQIISLPGGIGILCLLLLRESPKFLLSRSRCDEALQVLRTIHETNNKGKDNYEVTYVNLEELCLPSKDISLLNKIWNQTAPLFKPPLLKNSVILYYILLCAYMTSTGYTMWVPTMTNAFFTGEDSSGRTFCEVASKSATTSNSNNNSATAPRSPFVLCYKYSEGDIVASKFTETTTDCDHIVKQKTLFAVMCYSGISAVCTVLLSFLVSPLGKKVTTLLVFAVSALCGLILLVVRVPILSIMFFYLFLYVALILGNVNTYLVEVNPTHLRGMATCLSVVVARGFGFISVQLIAGLLADYCTPLISGYVVLVISGFVVATFLPAETKPTEDASNCDQTHNQDIMESTRV